MYGQLPQVVVRLAGQSIILHQLLDQFCHRMREQVQSCGIQVRPFSQVGCKEIDGIRPPHTFRDYSRQPSEVGGIVMVSGVTFHDLRGTAVTRLVKFGCTVPEIANITGHSLRDVHAILDSNYLARDPALAESAIRKLAISDRH
jgi:integrase